jgi:serine/threonine-protein kinase HipA
MLPFTYDPAWLEGGHSLQLDPDLRLFGGSQYLDGADRTNFGIFIDPSPDRGDTYFTASVSPERG